MQPRFRALSWVLVVVGVAGTPGGSHATCIGDCDGNGRVVVNELVTSVRIALDTLGIDACRAIDADGNEHVTVNELILGVNNALKGCPPTATATPTGTPVPVNHAPAIVSTPVTTARVGIPYSYSVVGSDPDAGDNLTYSLNGAPLGMTIDARTGAITWLPVITQAGQQRPTAQVSDGHGGMTAQTFAVTVAEPHANRPPAAQDDRYSIRRNETLAVPASGVLTNDVDPDGDPLTSTLVSTTTKGALSLAADGSFTYAPTEPPPGSTEPMLKFGYTDPDGVVTYTVNQPVVVDLDKDGAPEIVFISWNTFLQRRLIAVHGKDGSPLFSVDLYQPDADPPLVVSQEALAVGDLDGDGFPEIVTPLTDAATGDRSQLIAFNHDGSVKWRSESVIDDPLVDSVRSLGSGSFTKPLLADLDGDGTPEIVIGYDGSGPSAPALGAKFVTAFDHRGQIVWTAQGSVPVSGNGTVVAQDIDLDGRPEVVFQNDVFDNHGTLRWSASDVSSFELSISDVAVANLDADPFAEIVFLDVYDQLYLYDEGGARKWGPIATVVNAYPGSNLVTIGDVDGDGTPEIVVVGDTSIAAVQPDGTVRTIPLPYSAASPTVGRTAAIFDLNGDGKPELLYTGVGGPNDNNGTLFILDGQSGTPLYSITSPRISTDGSPIIADVDGDGTAEIVTPSSGFNILLRVFTAQTGRWAQARPVYNQSSYHVTNVTDDGSIPAHEPVNWLTPGLNNYRVNVPLPQERTEDSDEFSYLAHDGTLDSNIATVHVDILPPNHAPSILSQPPAVAAPNLEYLYAVRAVDPDVGEVHTFELAQAPVGMSIDAATGLIRWTPTADQLGRHQVTAKVADSQGQSVFQGYGIDVVPAVAVPTNLTGQTEAEAEATLSAVGLLPGTVTSAPSNTVPAGHVIGFEPANGNVPTGSAIALVISSGVQTVPVPNVIGTSQAAAQRAISTIGLNVGHVGAVPSTSVPAGTIIAQNPAGGTAVPLGTAVDLLISIGTISLDGLASVIVSPANPLILIGQQQAFTATGIFADGTSRDLTGIVGWSTTAPAVASISPVGTAAGVADGVTDVQASVLGINGSATLMVRAHAADATPPTAEITAPATGTTITEPVDIIGSATDASFLRYDLELAPAGTDTFAVLQHGTEPVMGGSLGTLDPTMLLNGLYTLRLTVADRGGNESTTSINVVIDRQRKIGIFTLSFIDLDVPVAGLPITVTRTYDSRDKSVGDFGIGWRLDVQTLRLQTSRVFGTDWQVDKVGGGLGTYVLTPTGTHTVSLTLPSGRVEVFDLVITPAASPIVPFSTFVASYARRAETLGTLAPLDNASLLTLDNQPGEVVLLDDGTLEIYDPQNFLYTSPDGRQFVINTMTGVQSVRDANGNTVRFGASGIIHSSGIGVVFERDAQQRITSITDPSGNVSHYAYDVNGDLVSYTDALESQTRFTYDRSHGLLDIIDPRGNHGARNEYDASGRLIATTDADGHTIEFGRDLDQHREVVTDRLGHVTVLEYDADGNITAHIDALGKRTESTYDSRANQLTQTDPLGRVVTKTYDAQNNLLTVTDADGNQSQMTYNARNQVLTEINPLGGVITRIYDASGNLAQETDPDGRVTSDTYDATGQRLTTTQPGGRVTEYTYDGAGHQTSLRDATGHLQTFTVDDSGRRRSQTQTRTLSGAGTETIVNQFDYDARGNLTRVVDALGYETHTSYDFAGRATSRTDRDGNLTQHEYDARGNLIRTTYPDGSTEVWMYDAENNQTSFTDRDGFSTSYQYDALGRLIRTENPDSSATQRTYDDVGRLATFTDERGNTTRHTYAANQETVTDALGHVTIHQFDGLGRRRSTTDAAGHSTAFAYNSRNSLTVTTFPDGSTQRIAYDATGTLKTSETDQAAKTTAYEYDAVGRLTRVTDAAGGVSTYAYDEVGNLTQQTDAEGRRTTLEYDALGRFTRRTRPLGEQETFTYDRNGNVLSHTDFNGKTTTFTYDVNNRLQRETLSDGTIVAYAYTAAGRRTQAGAATYTYDARGRMTSEKKESGETIAYEYDAVGNRTKVTTPYGQTVYTFDALNRLRTVADGSGTTTYSYDAVGNRASETYPNGVSTTYEYDALNRLTKVTNTGPSGSLSSYSYTIGAAGNRTQVVEAGSATTGRTVAYSYDADYRLTGETVDEPGTANDRAITYTYDRVGNRKTKTEAVGIRTTSVAYTYDDDDRLTTERQSGAVASSSKTATASRFAVLSVGLSPFFGALVLVPLTRPRRRTGRRARRRHAVRATVVTVLVTTSALAPAVARAVILDGFGPRTVAAQGATPVTLTYQYDHNGNLISRSDGTKSDTYTFDLRDRLVAAQSGLGPSPGSVTYTYDADGIRTGKGAGGITTTYLTDKNRQFAQVLAEDTGGSIVTYTYGDDRISMARPATGVRFYQRDGQQSTRQLTNSAGAVTDSDTYDAFGVLLSSSGSTPNEFLYTGEQLDGNVGFYYLRARYYAQSVGRFISTDPARGRIFDPVSLHRYLYANAGPVDHADPSGRNINLVTLSATAVVIGTVVGIAVGGIVGRATNPLVGFLTTIIVIPIAIVLVAAFPYYLAPTLVVGGTALSEFGLAGGGGFGAYLAFLFSNPQVQQEVQQVAQNPATQQTLYNFTNPSGDSANFSPEILEENVLIFLFGLGALLKPSASPASGNGTVNAAGQQSLNSSPGTQQMLATLSQPNTRGQLATIASAMRAIADLSLDPQIQDAAALSTRYLALSAGNGSLN